MSFTRITAFKGKFALSAVLALFWVSSAYALPIDPGGGTPGQQAALQCIENTVTTFTATPSTIELGATTTLQWSVKFPSNCPAHGPLKLGTTSVANTGSTTMQPMTDATYSLTVAFASTTGYVADVSVQVHLPTVVDINGSTGAWKKLLFQALGTPNTTVRLAGNVDMDLSNFESVYVVNGVTLMGGQPCAAQNAPPVFAAARAIGPIWTTPVCGARSPQNLGPRLYTTTRPRPLFNVRCDNDLFHADNVHFTGFRLQGPHMDPQDGDDNLEQGIYIESWLGIDIGNMELSGWSGQAIYDVDPARRQLNPDAVKVHDSFLHNNQHLGGNGYGVEVSADGYANIEHNVFDFNRHAISASGKPGTGYRADRNLVLRGGGYHGSFFNEYTHIFDVHGDRNCPDTPLTQHIWNCGHAGDQFWITNNAFQYSNDYAFKIRGTPSIAAYVDNNVFVQGSPDDAVHQNESGMQLGAGAQSNTFGVDSFGHYGVCDFDGDGKDDLFLATGASWWYMSSARMQWTYLSPNTDRFDQVGVGDFDGDHRCDVFAVHGSDFVISSGGNTAWRSLGSFGIPFNELRFGDFNGDKLQDIFWRRSDGQWFVVSPGHYGLTPIESSGSSLDQLHFGDFNGDGITDVLAVSGGHWSVSWGGRGAWQTLNPMSDDLGRVMIADVDGNGVDDVVRWLPTGDTAGLWEVSYGGRTGWQQLGSISWPATSQSMHPAYSVHGYVGHFTGAPAADLLSVDLTRFSSILNRATASFSPYSLFAY